MSFTNYQPRNVLVTGGAGFIGSHFVRQLLAADSSVHIINLDLLTYAGSLNHLTDLTDEKRHTFIKGDITDSSFIAKLLRDYHIDTIVHFAAESHVDRSIAGPLPFMQTNVVGTFTLLENARNYWLEEQAWDATRCRFHHISTDEVYGSLSSEAKAFTEQSAYAPNSPYSASKAGADHWVRAYFHTYQLPVTLSHCSNNYGPQQHPEKLIPTIIQACLKNNPIPIYGNGGNVRDWIYVVDHCLGVIEVLKHGRIGEAYHLGGQFEITNLQVAKHICQVMDELYPKKRSHQDLITFVTDRPGHDWRYAMDITKAVKELAWKPTETFVSGIRKTISHFHLHSPF